MNPQYIGIGIGKKLMHYASAVCKEKGISCLNIFSDPNARGFYDKLGAKYMGESPSSIENRTVSLYEYNIN
ncbi:GNAT family N-acetyltransferase [Petroclostridium sp. X23]|uniref:GNAT family N-acetyltransferase n=1 Tax=Petroclostridium sp. X23 TaxID=3045146 RepID=UPI0024AE749F|nr:GNAT family N-acetyltransferase [Petroclostridium sp. X23]WHH61579.1 GNAT family N-acetyltransferase [Petroclostridium sp. X23]